MREFTGRWSVTAVDVAQGDGRHAPRIGSEIEIFEMADGGHYVVAFIPQVGEAPHALSVPRSAAHPEQLRRLPAPGEHGYLLHAELDPPAAAAGMTGRIGFGVAPGGAGNEDNDTATYTATKQRA